jgi:type VI secretion system secreted protein Hcp
MFDQLRARSRGPRHRPARPRRLGVEPLEARDVPAWAADPLATFAGDVAAPHQPDWVQMQVQTTSPRALLTFESAGADGSAFVPGRLAVFAGPAGHVRTHGTVTGPGYALRAVGSGIVFARVGAAGAGTGAFDLAVGLAGDVNGDHQVDAIDLDGIRALRGTRAGHDGYVPAADVNHNGVIGLGDLALAGRNLGNTVTVGPLTADQFLFAGVGALGLRDTRVSPTVQPGLSLSIPTILNGAPIALEAFSWGVSNPVVIGGGGTGRPTPTPFAFTMKTNAASPLLFQACVAGTRLPSATFTVGRRVGLNTTLLARWDFEDLFVSAYQTGGSGASSLQDAVNLDFARVHVTYIPVRPDGRPGTPVGAGWDFVTNEGWGGPGGPT